LRYCGNGVGFGFLILVKDEESRKGRDEGCFFVGICFRMGIGLSEGNLLEKRKPKNERNLNKKITGTHEILMY
jgi:hypothetical protein